MAAAGDAQPGRSSSVPSLPPPCPKSPPPYPDLYGKRREMAKVQMLEREIGFLQEELKSAEQLQPSSRCCKEITEFVVSNPDPLIPTNRKKRRSCSFWKWLCRIPCVSFSWICCCCYPGCCSIHLEMPRCCDCKCSPCHFLDCCSCSSCFTCTLPKWRCCCRGCFRGCCKCCSNCCNCCSNCCCSWPRSNCCKKLSCSRNCCIFPTCSSPGCSTCKCQCKCSCTCPICL